MHELNLLVLKRAVGLLYSRKDWCEWTSVSIPFRTHSVIIKNDNLLKNICSPSLNTDCISHTQTEKYEGVDATTLRDNFLCCLVFGRLSDAFDKVNISYCLTFD